MFGPLFTLSPELDKPGDAAASYVTILFHNNVYEGQSLPKRDVQSKVPTVYDGLCISAFCDENTRVLNENKITSGDKDQNAGLQFLVNVSACTCTYGRSFGLVDG